MKSVLTGSILLGCLVLGACTTTPDDHYGNAKHPGAGHHQLARLTDATWEQTLPADLARVALVKNAAYIRFNKQRVNSQNPRFEGNDGCNNISGGYQANNHRLRLGEIMSTKRACLGSSSNDSVSFSYALQQTTHYRFDHGNLVLLDDANHIQMILRQISR